MRVVLTVLAVIALVVVVIGAVNHAATLRMHYLVGTSPSFSVFWLALVVAGIVVVGGLAAGTLALGSAAGGRRVAACVCEALR